MTFPIRVDGDLVNTVGAIWTLDKKEVTEEQYNDFYKFISSGYDKPNYRLNFRTGAPIDLKCLFYIPSFSTEKFGQGRLAVGFDLISEADFN